MPLDLKLSKALRKLRQVAVEDAVVAQLADGTILEEYRDYGGDLVRNVALACHNVVNELPEETRAELARRAQRADDLTRDGSDFERLRTGALAEVKSAENTVRDKAAGFPDWYDDGKNALNEPDFIWEIGTHWNRIRDAVEYAEDLVQYVEDRFGESVALRKWWDRMRTIQAQDDQDGLLICKLIKELDSAWTGYYEGDPSGLDRLKAHFLELPDSTADHCLSEICNVVEAAAEFREDRQHRKRSTKKNTRSPVVTVATWDQLGIGINTDKQYFAFVPCPEDGEVVDVFQATEIPFTQDHTKKVLELLAQSSDGKTASMEDLITAMMYAPGKLYSKRPDELADIGTDEELKILKSATDQVRKTMANQSRVVRKLITSGDGEKNIFKKENRSETGPAYYRSLMRVRQLTHYDDGQVRFGTPADD